MRFATAIVKHYKIVLALGIALFLYLKLGANKKVLISQPNDTDLNGIPDGWAPEAFTEKLHASMQDWFALRANEKESLWREMVEFTDGQLKLIYNYFNLKFSGKVGKSLTQMIDSEIGWAFGSINKTLVGRLRSLNLN